MSLLTRSTRAAARPLRQTLIQTQQQQRNVSRTDQPDTQGHGDQEGSAFHADSGATGSEGFGKGFYLTLAAIPFMYFTYTISQTKDNIVSRSYRSYKEGLSKQEAQDVLHSAALEQAIADRALYFSEQRSTTKELRYPEMFNHGSPFNVSAGEGVADLRELQKFYEDARARSEQNISTKLSEAQRGS